MFAYDEKVLFNRFIWIVNNLRFWPTIVQYYCLSKF